MISFTFLRASISSQLNVLIINFSVWSYFWEDVGILEFNRDILINKKYNIIDENKQKTSDLLPK